MGSVVLPHLVTGWHVDQAIMSEEERLVVIRFGRDWDPDCMRQDEVLYRTLPCFPFPPPTCLPPASDALRAGIADRVKNFAVIYVCDLDQVPDFKQMYGKWHTGIGMARQPTRVMASGMCVLTSAVQSCTTR
jgi:DIM1 family U5 snRNP protein